MVLPNRHRFPQGSGELKDLRGELSGLDADPGRASHRLLVELGGKGRVAVVGQGPLELAVVDAAQGQRR